MTPDRLAHMANHIAGYFAAYGHDQAIEGIADHLQKFWEPRMRRALLAQVASGGAGLDPLVVEAARRLERSRA